MKAVVFELPHPDDLGEGQLDRLVQAIKGALAEHPPECVRQVTSYRGRPGVMIQLPEDRMEQACEAARWILWDADVDFVEHLYFDTPKLVPAEPSSPAKGSRPGRKRRRPDHVAEQVSRRLEAGRAFCRMDLHSDARSQFLAARHLDPGSAEAAYGLGVVEAHEGRMEEAERWLREAIALDAGRANYHYVLGGICHKSGRLEEAEGLLKRSVELEPGEAAYFDFLGWIYLDMGDLNRAASAFDEALQRCPDLVSAMSGLGSVHFADGRMEDSVAMLEQALEEDPEYAVARLQIAWCRFHQGDLDLAEVDFLQVLHGDNPELESATCFGLGRLYLRRGTLALAVEYLRRAAEDDWPPATWMLGEALFLSGCFDEAARTLEHALEMDPSLRDEVETRLALCFLRMGQLEKSEHWIHRVMESRGRHSAMLELLGAIHGHRGNWEEAREVLSEACALEPDCAPAFFQLGWIAENLEDVEEARRCYLRALRLDPHCLEAATHLGWLFLDDERPGEAAVIFEAALETHPEDPELLYSLGRTLFVEGKYEKSADLLHRALLRSPESPETRAWFGAALVSLGQAEEGRRELRQALKEGPDEETTALCRRLLRRRAPHREPLRGRAKADALKSVS